MDPASKIEKLEAKVEELEAKIEEWENQLKETGISETKELAILALITETQSTIKETQGTIKEYLKAFNATTTTSGTIHL